jgi:glycerol dehydrogenase-like iron-containing ADH family enzyme
MKDDRGLAEALILSGIAMENGSQYCSGSEHETERLLERYFSGKYLHGQLAGTGTLISAKVYSQYVDKLPRTLTFDSSEIFEQLVSLMRRLDLLEFALHPLQESRFNPNSLKGLTKVRPERYTLWNEIDSEKVDWQEVIDELFKIS